MQSPLKILNKTKNTIVAENGIMADTFLSRLVGLLGRQTLRTNEALIITRCQSIHMFFMRFAIDAIFVDKSRKVVGLVANIKPFQLSRIFWQADCCVEIAPGVIVQSKTQIGDQLDWA